MFRSSPMVRRVRSLACILLALAASVSAHAQTTKSEARTTELSVAALERRMDAVEARKDMEPATRAKIIDTYRRAIEETEAAARAREEARALRSFQTTSPATIQSLEAKLADRTRAVPKPVPVNAGANLSSDQLAELQARARADRDQARQAAAEADRAYEAAVSRPAEARAQRELFRKMLEDAEATIAGAEGKSSRSPLADAEYELARARRLAASAQLDRLEQSFAVLPAQTRVAKLERDLARAEADAAEETLRETLALVEAARVQELQRARDEAARERTTVTDDPAIVRETSAANIELRAAIAQAGLDTDRLLAQTAAHQNQASLMERNLRAAERRAEVRAFGPELAGALFSNIRSLPRLDQFLPEHEKRAALLAATSTANYRVDREIVRFSDLDAVLREELAKLPPGADRTRAEARLRRLLADRRDLLTQANEQYEALLIAIDEAEASEADLLAAASAARQRILGLVLWVPLTPLSSETPEAVARSLGEFASPRLWKEATAGMASAAARHPLRSLAVVLVLGLLLVTRPRLKAKLAALVPPPDATRHPGAKPALAALLITLLLALPWALPAWAIGWLLAALPGASGTLEGLGIAFQVTGTNLFVGVGLGWFLARRGVAVGHFGWNAERCKRLQGRVTRFLPVYVAIAFVALGLSVHAEDVRQQALGQVALILMLIALAIFFARAFHPRQSILVSDSGVDLLPPSARRRITHRALVALPVALAIFAAMGYYFGASYLYRLLVATSLLALGTVMLYSLAILWALGRRERLTDETAMVVGDPATIAARGVLDVGRIDKQTRQMINLAATMLVLFGLWWIWQWALPALGTITGTELWAYTTKVDGETLTRHVTIADLLVAIVIGVVAAVAAKSIGGVLDAVLLDRLALQADANYAIKTVTRYLIIAVSVLSITNLLGISWANVQWLVAALGVGLGFGLQEIVANFISGLIVLAERPIRLGDVITVGDVTGVVTRIRARATSITDFDNKEVIVPNKSFITERVTNWTLSSRVTRVVLKVGVAYGTDPQRARTVIMEAVQSVPLVLQWPPASVFFTRFGDSALEFDVRAYADGTDNRLPLTDAVNTAINAALIREGIAIPFPQRDLHIRTVTADALKSVTG